MRLTSMLFALVLLSCGGGLSNKLCGATGQPCCAMDACDPGAVCSSSQVCEACGSEGQQCCAMGACNDALACGNGKCGMALSCGVTCTLGSSRCVNNGIETCAAIGVCPGWQTTIAACPSGATCVVTGSSADCVEACPGACSPGTQVCSINGLRSCSSSGGTCPMQVALTDNADLPLCTTGAVVTPELAWESPTPMGNEVADIAGDLPSSYWVLDHLGNVYRYAGGPWETELTVSPNRRVLHIASCRQISRLYAGAESGTVYRRSAGMWTEENVGSNTTIVDIDCDSSFAWALGADNRLYYRTGTGVGTWASVPTGATQPLTSITALDLSHEVYLAGNAGAVVRCDTTNLPPVCANESSHTTTDLTAIWGDPFSGVVFAVGKGGTYLQRGAIWQTVAMPGVGTDTFAAITGYYDPTNMATWQVAITETGKLVVREDAMLQETTQLPENAQFASVWMPNLTTILAGNKLGGLWFRPGAQTINEFVPRGGRTPLSGDLRAVASAGGGRLFAVGDQGLRAQRLNDTWTLDQIGVSTQAALFGVAVRTAGEVYAVGDLGTVLVRRFGVWALEAENLTTETLSAVVLDSDHVWVLGQTLLLEKTFTTGRWRVIPLPTAITPYLQFGFALRTDPQGRAVELVVAGVNCTLVSYSPATGLFTDQSCINEFAFLTAAFNSTGDLFLASDKGIIAHRIGTTLVTETNANTLEPFYALVPDGSTMWALSNQGGLYRRTGSAWINTSANVTASSFLAGVRDDTGLYVVGVQGLVMHRQ